MRKSVALVVSALLLIVLAVLAYNAVRIDWPRHALRGPRRTLTIGLQPLEASGLIYVAQAQSYIQADGLELVLREYETGEAALHGMLRGECDLAVSSEYAVVEAVLEDAAPLVVAGVDRFETWSVVSRGQRGRARVSDLAGRRVALERGTAAEFYLGRMLQLAGLNLDEVTLIDAPQATVRAAVVSGVADAAVLRHNDARAVQAQLDSAAWVLPVQGGQQVYALLSGRPAWCEGHSPELVALLEALARARGWVMEHPREAQAIVAQALGEDRSTIAAAWPQHEFELSLDESLLTAMEDEARWLIARKRTGAQSVPWFRDSIDGSALEEVIPGAVDTFR